MKVIAPTLLFLLISASTFGQNCLQGEFVHATFYEKKAFNFNKDGTFSYIEKACGMIYKGNGHYSFTKNTIFLDFNPQEDKTIGVLSIKPKQDSIDPESTVQVFAGFRHRNDIEFHYVLYYKDSTSLKGVGDGYHDLSFYPKQLDSLLVSTYFKSVDSLILYQENLINVKSTLVFNYTLLSLPKDGKIYLGRERNKEYKIRVKRKKNKFKLLETNGWVEYQLIEN